MIGEFMLLALLAAAASLLAQTAGPLEPRRQPASGRATFRSDADLVLIPVDAADRRGRFVDGLKAADFRVADDGAPVPVQSCSVAAGPLSAVVVLDESYSMRDMQTASRAALDRFLQSTGPGDTVSVITVRDRVQVAVDATNDADEVIRRLGISRADGETALLDGVYLGLHMLMKGKGPRRLLLVLSDGGDNASRYGPRDIESAALEADARIFAIATGTPMPLGEEYAGRDVLSRLARETGGRFFAAKNPTDMAAAVDRIDAGRYYLLGFAPRGDRDGRPRRVEVKLVGSRAGVKLSWRRHYRRE